MPILNMIAQGSGGGWWGSNVWEPTNLSALVSSRTSVDISWTDNWLQAIPPSTFQKSVLVRKVGSAPATPSDWTTVVTETVMNTYQSIPFSDTWLTEWTTYYYQVFSYSTDWGITYWTPVSATPQSWWQPWANTIAYFPFINDKNNTISGSNISISSSNIWITTIDGIKCLYFDWSATQSLNIWFRTQDITSVMVWIKWWYAWQILEQRNTTWWDDDRKFIIGSNTIIYERYQSSSAHITWPTISDTNWHCIWITEDSNWCKLFLDGNASAVATDSSTRTFSILTTDTWIWCRVNNGSSDLPATWYMGGLVLMDAAITVTDFLDYYNQTKWDYWIS